MAPTIGTLNEFDPNNENFDVYSDRLKLYITANSIEEEKKVAVLLTLIGGKVYSVLHDLCCPEILSMKKFDELMEILNNHYSPSGNVIAERFKFNKYHQLPLQSVNDYAACLKKLANTCQFGTFLDEILRDKLIEGLNDSSLQTELVKKNDHTFMTALKFAQAFEYAVKTVTELQKSTDMQLEKDIKIETPATVDKMQSINQKHDTSAEQFSAQLDSSNSIPNVSDENLMKNDDKTNTENCVKNGYLKINHKGIIKSTTKEYFFILYPQSENATARLLQYSTAESADKNKYSPELTVLPSDVEHVDPLPGEDSKFMVLCLKEKLILDAKNDIERNSWITALKVHLLNNSDSLNEYYFQVRIHKETQECLGDLKSVYLIVNCDEISIIAEDGTYLARWPYSEIVNNGTNTEQRYLFVTTGKSAQHGEGTYKFYSTQFETITKCIRQKVESASVQSTSITSRSVTPVAKMDPFLELAANKYSIPDESAYLRFDEIHSPVKKPFLELASNKSSFPDDNAYLKLEEIQSSVIAQDFEKVEFEPEQEHIIQFPMPPTENKQLLKSNGMQLEADLKIVTPASVDKMQSINQKQDTSSVQSSAQRVPYRRNEIFTDIITEKYVKKGYLKIHNKGIMKLTKEYFFILYPRSENAKARLQQFKTAEAADKSKYPPDLNVLSCDVVFVDPLPGEDSKFMVQFPKEMLILGAENDFERSRWIIALKEHLLNDIGSLPEKSLSFNEDYFQVRIHKENRDRLGDHNSVYLTVDSDEISIITEDGTYLAKWPYSTIKSRGINEERQYFYVRTGKSAQHGEGIFTFYSPQFEDINNCVKQIWKSAPVKSSSALSKSVTHVQKQDPFLEWATNKTSHIEENVYDSVDVIQSSVITAPSSSQYGNPQDFKKVEFDSKQQQIFKFPKFPITRNSKTLPHTENKQLGDIEETKKKITEEEAQDLYSMPEKPKVNEQFKMKNRRAYRQHLIR